MNIINDFDLFKTALKEGYGEAIALSVLAPKHLAKIGFLEDATISKELEMNTLMARALADVVFLKYSYGLELWRFNFFEDRITQDQFNDAWWKIRYFY